MVGLFGKYFIEYYSLFAMALDNESNGQRVIDLTPPNWFVSFSLGGSTAFLLAMVGISNCGDIDRLQTARYALEARCQQSELNLNNLLREYQSLKSKAEDIERKYNDLKREVDSSRRNPYK